MQRIGLLFEHKTDIMSMPNVKEETHYHWREPEEVTAVASHLEILGYEVDLIGTVDALLERWRHSKLPDFVWNLSVRTLSRNRTAIAPAILEQLNLPYTGGDATAKSLTLNKDFLKPVLQWLSILTPQWRRYDNAINITSLPPWSSILKPVCEGYSLGLRRFDSSQGLDVLRAYVNAVSQQFGCAVLCEEFIAGREITVGVVGNGKPIFVSAVETVNQGESLQEEILDLDAKRQGRFQKIGVDLTKSELHTLHNVAVNLMEFLGDIDYATFDFRIANDGRAYLLDINADATLHPERSLAMIAKYSGLSYGDLIEAILKTSLQRWKIKN
ncbi:D-alanine--D-alanine ligase A [Calothrix sp. NIES-4071]|nr:D-alanine--D-alanine ligase A [Calothrix sp. NIES-4071]BAZ64133.1 D-alanine--D-alanine ligase A [Calothrix sp. NIES-4105]